MQYQRGMVTHNVTALRAMPDGGSEQVSQAILGDGVVVLEEKDDWVRVQTADAYEGWMRRLHACALGISDPASSAWPFDGEPEAIYRVISEFADLTALPGEPTSLITKLVFGTWVRRVGSPQTERNGTAQVAVPFGPAGSGLIVGAVCARHLQEPAAWLADLARFDGVRACSLAKRFLGVPYLWGGTTPFGFDCSGFVQRIYRMMGVMLPRDAHLQATSPLGRLLADDAPVQAGDLIFFTRPEASSVRKIVHVGMVLDAERYIHAAGDAGVVVTLFDDPHYSSRYSQHGIWRYGRDA
jgi:hypothetical protein